MNQLLDHIGLLLFAAFRIIVLPLLFALYLFFTALLLIRIVKMGIKVLSKVKFKKSTTLYRLTRYGYYLGKFMQGSVWHR